MTEIARMMLQLADANDGSTEGAVGFLEAV